MGTISLPNNTQVLGLGVSSTFNKIFAADDNSGNLLIIDGTSHAVVGQVAVGGTVFDVIVSEKRGKVFVASNTDSATSGLNPGTGLISVIDAANNQLITTVNLYAPGTPVFNTSFSLQLDEVHDKVYAMFRNPFAPGVAVIDTVTNAPTVLSNSPQNLVNFFPTALNGTTHEFIIGNTRDRQLLFVNGATNTTTTFNLDPTGARGPLNIAVNEPLNKIYVTMVTVPGQGEIGIMILDRDDMSYKFVGKDDLEPMAFNPLSNHLFSGVQVGSHGAVVNGTTDQLTPVAIAGGGIGDIDIRRKSDFAYMASQDTYFALHGGTLALTTFTTTTPPRGGLVSSSVAVNQKTGRVYMVPDDQIPTIFVVQDPMGATTPPRPADFDGDGDTDISVFRPADGGWYRQGQGTTFFGLAGDIPVPGDYDGNGSADIAAFRPSVGGWYTVGAATAFFGLNGDIPVPCDYDGNGTTDRAVFRPSVGGWYRDGAATTFFGLNGDIPVPGDYDGNGTCDVAVFRPSVGGWYRDGAAATFFGLNGDIPVPGDYDNNASADVAVFRPSVGGWYRNGGPTTFLGLSGDIPVPGDYDGNGSADVAAFRPSSGQWFRSGQAPVSFGVNGDRPLPLPSAIRQAFFS